MRIAVLIKEVPDTYGQRTLDLTTGLADRAASDRIPDEISGRALEVALGHRDSNSDTEVVALLMGPSVSETTLRNAFAMGADRAVHILDDALAGADHSLTAEALAAAVERLDVDLVVAGAASTDGAGGVIPAMLGERLGRPALTNLRSVTIGAEVSGQRVTEDAVVDVAAELPAIVSVTDSLPEARYPGFKGIMAAKKKTIEVLSAADLGLEVADDSGNRSIVVAVAQRPARAAGTTIVDDGGAAKRLADYLAAAELI